ncbi:hypothetical protein MTo_02336 [Microcystis aeruginosa NIES-1211]|jgi:hypothetical protein|nr:hypothetical protein MTo_02336 [Microcystis aeruginosa NIES-1211]GCA87822.1 hypothetical protein MiTa_01161 [Microcystis aeruginosa NIES-4264]
MVFLEAIYPIFVVAFSVDLEGFSWQLIIKPLLLALVTQ